MNSSQPTTRGKSKPDSHSGRTRVWKSAPWTVLWILPILVVLGACSRSELAKPEPTLIQPMASPTIVRAAINSPLPADQIAPASSAQLTNTAIMAALASATPREVAPVEKPEPTSTATPKPLQAPSAPLASLQPSASPTVFAPASGTGLVIDHTSVADFERIPDETIRAASQLHMLLRHASIGKNLDEGLNCLANSFPENRPNFCDQGVPPEQVVYDPKYNRSNWTFEPHNLPNPNPGWWKKITNFADRIDAYNGDVPFEVVSYTVDYLDVQEGSNLDEVFFQGQRNGNLPNVQDLVALEAAHPDLTVIWWTSNLARVIGSPDSETFNQQMRDFAWANGKVLFDMADIEFHAPDGTPCVDSQGRGLPAICQDYTSEKVGGHLNALGTQRVAKALWVLMARLAGWEG